MFEKLKKNKTLRSILGATALFVAGTPTVVEAAPKESAKITQTVKSDCKYLAALYRPLCEQLEGNLPYCYCDKSGGMTVGCGVHFKDFSSLNNLTVLKIIPQKNRSFSLTQRERLMKMANADWGNVVTKALFPEVEKVEVIKIKDCSGECPKNTDKKWTKALFLMPESTLDQLNRYAMEFYAQKAYEFHPNLSNLCPSARLVVLDLMYNLGANKYFKTYPKFRKAVNSENLSEMKKEGKTHNNRRDSVRGGLIDSAVLVKAKGPYIKKKELCETVFSLLAKQNPSLTPKRETRLCYAINLSNFQNCAWSREQAMTKMVRKNQLAKNKNL